MLIVSRGQSVQFKFIFISEGNIYDPTNNSTPLDIYFSVIRGEYGSGPIIDGPYSYLIQEENPEGPTYIEKSNSKELLFITKFQINYMREFILLLHKQLTPPEI